MFHKDKKIYANKIIQTRKVEQGKMSIGTLLTLITDINYDPSQGIRENISAHYFYVGSTNDIGYFVLADIVNERALLEYKKKIEQEEKNYQMKGNIIQLTKHHEI